MNRREFLVKNYPPTSDHAAADFKTATNVEELLYANLQLEVDRLELRAYLAENYVAMRIGNTIFYVVG